MEKIVTAISGVFVCFILSCCYCNKTMNVFISDSWGHDYENRKENALKHNYSVLVPMVYLVSFGEAEVALFLS